MLWIYLCIKYEPENERHQAPWRMMSSATNADIEIINCWETMFSLDNGICQPGCLLNTSFSKQSSCKTGCSQWVQSEALYQITFQICDLWGWSSFSINDIISLKIKWSYMFLLSFHVLKVCLVFFILVIWKNFFCHFWKIFSLLAYDAITLYWSSTTFLLSLAQLSSKSSSCMDFLLGGPIIPSALPFWSKPSSIFHQ